jgi:NDP-sugar pyrophosphorylase family protein
VIPYGVCEVKNGGELSSINEKPGYDYLINTGMYLMKKKLIDLIPSSKYFNMDNLIKKIQDKGYKIGVFPISESAWTDVGQWDEYHKAVGKLGL